MIKKSLVTAEVGKDGKVYLNDPNQIICNRCNRLIIFRKYLRINGRKIEMLNKNGRLCALNLDCSIHNCPKENQVERYCWNCNVRLYIKSFINNYNIVHMIMQYDTESYHKCEKGKIK